MQGPLISVMTCTYNGGRFLPRCYATLMAQTFENWEWVVVDDGSTDDTQERLKEIARVEPRLRAVVLKENRGRAVARTRALEAVCGEWTALWDVDDFFFPDRLEAIRAAAVEGWDYWVSLAVQTTVDLRVRGIQDFYRPFPAKPYVMGLHGAMAFRTALGRTIGYLPHLRTFGGMGEDAGIVLECAFRYRGKFDRRPLMVNVTGNEVALEKSMAARRIIMETNHRLWREGAIDVEPREYRRYIRRSRNRLRALSCLRVCPWMYPRIMGWRMRGTRAMSVTLEPKRRAFLDQVAREMPANGRDGIGEMTRWRAIALSWGAEEGSGASGLV